MRKLPRPDKDPREFFELCISKSRPRAKKVRLEESVDAVEASCAEYEAKATSGELHEFSHDPGLPASEDELYKVYDSGCRIDGPGRDYYDGNPPLFRGP